MSDFTKLQHGDSSAAPIHDRVYEILDAIEREDDGEGVIPIVGQDLLDVEVSLSAIQKKETTISPPVFQAIKKVLTRKSVPTNLPVLMAEIMAEWLQLRKGGAANRELAQVIARHPQIDSNRFKVDTELRQIYSALEPAPPSSLRKLASIRKLDLFITTTGDDLLERALNDERFGGQPLTQVLSFAPTRRPSDEDIAKALSSGFPVVFHLFGRFKSPGCVALTESDFVDYMAALLDRESRPRRIFSELKGKHLLLVGNNFQDWLAGFFLRLTRDTPLTDHSGGVQYVLERDKSLASFVRRCAKKAEPIDDADPGVLLCQLADCWAARREQEGNDSANPRTNNPADEVGGDWIFISYPRTDLSGKISADVTRANRLAEALQKDGFKVWMDMQGGLTAGDDYTRKIQTTIARCGIFIPICSTVAQMRPDTADEAERPFYRREWTWALERWGTLKQREPARKFVFPVVVDDLPFDKSNVPEDFKILQASTLLDGEPTSEFKAELRRTVQDLKRQEKLRL